MAAARRLALGQWGIGSLMHQTYRYMDRHVSVDVRRTDEGSYHVVVDGQPHEIEAALLNQSTLYMMRDGIAQTARIARVGESLHIALEGAIYVFTPDAGTVASDEAARLASPEIIAPMPGKILQLLVQEGQEVQTGDGLLILEAMKMENRMVAEAPGVVRRVLVSEGQMVDGGSLLLELEYHIEES